MIKETREAVAPRPVLLVDSGDALHYYLRPGTDRGQAETSARSILAAMGAMGYVAMAIGPRDLVLGYDLLQAATQEAGVRLLGANLEVSAGRRPIDPYEIVVLDGVKVALIGLSTADHCVEVSEVFRSAGVMATDPVAAGKKIVSEVRGKADVIIVLGNLTEREATEVGSIDGVHLLLTGGTGSVLMGQELESTLRYEPGNRGQLLLQLDLRADGAQRLFDARRGRSMDGPAPVSGRVESRAHALVLNIAEDSEIRALLDAGHTTPD